MSSNLDGMREKFFVMKLGDIEKYLDNGSIMMLVSIIQKIMNGREKDGKKENQYIVINIDEPYIEEIVETLKKNEQWG